MNGLPPWIIDIENLSRGLEVLLVEGEDDVDIFRHFLDQHSPGWETRRYLAAANGKRRVIQAISVHRRNWFGIIDQDEWTPEDVQEVAGNFVNIRQLPRFCIESYFCEPNEIWAALPESQKSHLNNNFQQLAQPILSVLPDWVAHGALWRVLQRLKKSTGLPEELENRPVTDEIEIRRILETWHDQLAPEAILDQYHLELARANTLTTTEQLIGYIHGKKFFKQVVVITLNNLFAQISSESWIGRFQNSDMMPPQDMKDLLDRVISNL